ncbi:MAG: hypothetical protein A2Y23_12080 [Clostridiales bacterium GWB2_37_7]|nr:MAG: hypothetical protein A2Y23_12080 [Clostridiales bacterium GWB2_37_7]
MIWNKKVLIRGLSIGMTVLTITGTGLLAGCTVKENPNAPTDRPKPIEQVDIQSKILSDFDALLASNPKTDAIIEFIDKNISSMSKENAVMMISKLEEGQKKDLPKLEEKYYSEAIQAELQKIYKPGFDLNKLDEIQAAELKDLLTETRDMGYKIETAEGTYFPVMNYEFYKKYSGNVTEDIKQYIELMAVESNETPIKDAALTIGWDEIIDRALAQEQFIKSYASSAKVDAIKELQKRYLTFILYGSNNTPLFSYETKVMKEEAKTTYTTAVKDNQDSETMQMLGKYLEILSKTDYKFSDTADQFRKDVVEKGIF